MMPLDWSQFKPEYDRTVRTCKVHIYMTSLDNFEEINVNSIKHWGAGFDFNNRETFFELTTESNDGLQLASHQTSLD
jgi:hypothetical protein